MRAPSEPMERLDKQHRSSEGGEAATGGNTCGTGAHDRDVKPIRYQATIAVGGLRISPEPLEEPMAIVEANWATDK